MLWNLLLIFLVFGAAKKKINPYGSSVVLGALKGVLYFLATGSIIVALIATIVFAALAAGVVFFLAQVDRKELSGEAYPKYGFKKKGKFHWEYVPLSVIVVLLIFGEMMVNLALH